MNWPQAFAVVGGMFSIICGFGFLANGWPNFGKTEIHNHYYTEEEFVDEEEGDESLYN